MTKQNTDQTEPLHVPTDLERAFHEAAHAVMGYLFYSVDYVNINPGEIDDKKIHGLAGVNMPDDCYLGGAENEEKFIDYLKAIICLRSGRYFQRSVLGNDDPQGAESDDNNLTLLLYNNNNQFYTPFQSLSSLIVMDFCNNNSIAEMVAALANVLVIKKELTKGEIAEILKGMPTDHDKFLKSIKDKYYRGFCIALGKLNIVPKPSEQAS